VLRVKIAAQAASVTGVVTVAASAAVIAAASALAALAALACGRPQRQLTGEKATGTVKFFNAMKGFGFVQRDDGQPDVFVHISAVERAGMSNLNEGDRIEFDIEVDGRGKYAAVNITSSS
jgi:CspA family cold shock protein